MVSLSSFIAEVKGKLLQMPDVKEVVKSPYDFDEGTDGLDVYTKDGERFEITITKVPK